MNERLDRALRDEAGAFRTPTPEPTGGLDEAMARGRARRRTRRALLSGVVVLALVAAAGGLRVGTDRRDIAVVPATEAPTSTRPGTAPTTLVPSTTTAAGTTPTTTAPSTAVPVTTTSVPTTTIAASDPTPPGPIITSWGVLGVPFGTPMDEAVARLTVRLGAPDSDGIVTPLCGSGPIRVVRWGALEIHSYRLPDDNTFRTLAYGWDPDGRTVVSPTPELRIGGHLLGGPPRPMAEVEATVRSLVDGPTAEETAQDMFMVWGPNRKVDVILQTTDAGTTMTAIAVYDQTTGTNGC